MLDVFQGFEQASELSITFNQKGKKKNGYKLSEGKTKYKK